MDRMIHLSHRAMQGVMNRQTAIAHNMANADTTGFRAEIVSAQAQYLHGEGLQSRASPNEYVLTADLNPGPVEQTGRPLDIAMNGQTMLAVQAPNGDEGYTRRGDLMMNETGLLTTGDGFPVLGEGGPLVVPPADSIQIAEDGGVWVVPKGGDPNQPQQIDRLRLVNPKGSEVVKAEDTLFRVKNGGALPSDPDARLQSGALEGSNVNMTQALVDMIETSRAYEAQVKLMQSAKEMDDGGASVMQLPR